MYISVKFFQFVANLYPSIFNHFGDIILVFIKMALIFVHVLIAFTIFTALHVMQPRYGEEISVCVSVCLSVRLSVTRVDCGKTVERSVQIYIPYERTFILVF